MCPVLVPYSYLKNEMKYNEINKKNHKSGGFNSRILLFAALEIKGTKWVTQTKITALAYWLLQGQQEPFPAQMNWADWQLTSSFSWPSSVVTDSEEQCVDIWGWLFHLPHGIALCPLVEQISLNISFLQYYPGMTMAVLGHRFNR